MLARRGTLRLCNGEELQLPLLVPAFSSKGFQLHSTGTGNARRRYSDIALELLEFGKEPNKAVLVSAYDLHHKHLSPPNTSHAQQSAYLKKSRAIFVDSGGYELAADFDSTEPRTWDHEPDPFSEDQYVAVLQQLARPALKPPLIIANYDHNNRGQPFELQVKAGRKLFARFPDFGSDFIIKPWHKKKKFVEPEELSPAQLLELKGFDIIGVAEKDLGRNIMQRLERVARLRRRLNDAGIEAPIHVWGGLEPVATPLLFFAGAEIFDGISWLRYAFKDGFAIVRETYCVVSEVGITANRELNHRYASLDNRRSLDKLEIALQQWVDMEARDFSVFSPSVRKDLEKAYGAMTAQIPELTGEKNGGRRRR